jgi:hypothetical protein
MLGNEVCRTGASWTTTCAVMTSNLVNSPCARTVRQGLPGLCNKGHGTAVMQSSSDRRKRLNRVCNQVEEQT